MASEMCKDWILETIDQLRKRKARPDVDRICHMVERKHGLSSKDIEHELETLVDAGIVVKVEYKGSTSYRNAAKWKKSHLGGNVLNSNDVSRKLCTAVKCVCDNNSDPTDGNAGGAASLADIERWLSSNDAVTSLTGNDLELALTREIDQGNIKQLDSGKFIVVSEDEREKTTIQANVKGGGTSGKTPSPGRRGRPAGKRKRLKKSLPDYETEPANKTPRKESSSPTDLQSITVAPIIIQTPPAMNGDKPRCDFCQLTADRNPQGLVEDLLVCKDCQAKAHPSCMDYSNDLARRARNSPWQCIDCKTCYVCSDSGDPDAMLFCDACDKGYHMTCHEPEVMEKPHGKWICKQCMEELGIEEEEFQKEDTEDNQSLMETNTTDLDGTSCLPTPRESPVPFQADEIKTDVSSTQKPVNGHPTSADASEWTIEDVGTFLTKVGFPDQAGAFREQEIDGKSLLLMKRSDVLTGLSIKLGPALKIYRQVQKLQTGAL